MRVPDLEAPPKWDTHTAKRVLVLGLGNDILSDDAVGLNIARELRQRVSDADGIELRETSEAGLSLLDYVTGFDDLVLVDAVQTGQARPGFLHELSGSDLKILPTMSPHFLGIGEVLDLGRQLGLSVPSFVRVFAVEVQDPFTVSTQMTPALKEALPALVERLLYVLGGYRSAARVSETANGVPKTIH